MDKLNFYRRLRTRLHFEAMKYHSNVDLAKRRAKILSKINKRIKELENN